MTLDDVAAAAVATDAAGHIVRQAKLMLKALLSLT